MQLNILAVAAEARLAPLVGPLIGVVPLKRGLTPCVVKERPRIARGVVVEDYRDCVGLDMDPVIIVVRRLSLIVLVVEVAG